ncbi:MAG: hypothetical protein JWM76_4108 [Pseudonocardiales bacterium]|nr:hypothetical protein [Pseudonocardiales bacterium]
MTADASGLPIVPQMFVVVMEYRGPDLTATARGGEARLAVCEHAYELHSATLAGHHGGQLIRIAFPTRQRGWNTTPQAARCPACSAAVTTLVHELVRTALADVMTHLRAT